MVYVSRETPYMTHFAHLLERKYHLAVDSWGADDKSVKHAFDPLVELINTEVPVEEHRQLYPFPTWRVQKRVARLARATVFADFMVKQWAEHFAGMDYGQLDELAQSFKFENCLTRDGLNKVLSDDAKKRPSA